RRAIPEVSVEDVATRRTRGDAVLVLDVREKEEVRAGYIEGAITIPRGFLEFQQRHICPRPTQTSWCTVPVGRALCWPPKCYAPWATHGSRRWRAASRGGAERG